MAAIPGEPVLCPYLRTRPGDQAEDGVVVLSAVVLDAEAGRFSPLVLDAATFTELATARVPHVIPFGFHGSSLAAKERSAHVETCVPG